MPRAHDTFRGPQNILILFLLRSEKKMNIITTIIIIISNNKPAWTIHIYFLHQHSHKCDFWNFFLMEKRHCIDKNKTNKTKKTLGITKVIMQPGVQFYSCPILHLVNRRGLGPENHRNTEFELYELSKHPWKLIGPVCFNYQSITQYFTSILTEISQSTFYPIKYLNNENNKKISCVWSK